MCETCEDSANNCTKCSPNETRNMEDGECSCKAGHFLANPDDKDC